MTGILNRGYHGVPHVRPPLCLGALLGGCVSVAPYEREYRSSPAMNAELEVGESAFQAHIFDAREGATGGHGSGGCGCN